MEAIVLAGGYGRRLRSVIDDIPKPMAPISGRPFLEILLTHLFENSFERIVLSLGYRAEVIKNHFGDKYLGLELDYVVEDEPLGTGGAVRKAIDHCLNDDFFVLNGDSFLDLEVDKIWTLYLSDSKSIVVTRNVENTERFGKVIYQEDEYFKFIGKGHIGPGLVNAGCYVFPRNIFDRYKLPEKFSIEEDFLLKCVNVGEFNNFVSNGFFIDIGVPDDYKRAQSDLEFYS